MSGKKSNPSEQTLSSGAQLAESAVSGLARNLPKNPSEFIQRNLNVEVRSTIYLLPLLFLWIIPLLIESNDRARQAGERSFGYTLLFLASVALSYFFYDMMTAIVPPLTQGWMWLGFLCHMFGLAAYFILSFYSIVLIWLRREEPRFLFRFRRPARSVEILAERIVERYLLRRSSKVS